MENIKEYYSETAYNMSTVYIQRQNKLQRIFNWKTEVNFVVDSW